MGRDARIKSLRTSGRSEARRRLEHVLGRDMRDMSAQEVHAAVGIRKQCVGCGGPPRIRIRVLAPLGELMQRSPEFIAAIMATNPAGPTVPTIPTKYGPMVRISDTAACALCRATAEREAAKVPSWCIVEIDAGPGADRPLVQVAGLVTPEGAR